MQTSSVAAFSHGLGRLLPDRFRRSNVGSGLDHYPLAVSDLCTAVNAIAPPGLDQIDWAINATHQQSQTVISFKASSLL